MATTTISALRKISTCTISDALISLGISSGGFLPDIRPISSDGQTIAGPAYTVKFAAANDNHAPSLSSHFLDEAPSDSVICVQAPPESRNAVWGGLMSAAARTRGTAGVIISGRCRDVAEHRSLGYPVFARGNSTVGQRPFTRPSAINCRLTISPYAQLPVVGDELQEERLEGEATQPDRTEGASFPAVEVNPGDIIVADEDGVVCIPRELADKVIDVAINAQAVDERCLQDILAGKGVKETFKKHRGK